MKFSYTYEKSTLSIPITAPTLSNLIANPYSKKAGGMKGDTLVRALWAELDQDKGLKA